MSTTQTKHSIILVILNQGQDFPKMDRPEDSERSFHANIWFHARQARAQDGVEWTLLDGTDYGLPTTEFEELGGDEKATGITLAHGSREL